MAGAGADWKRACAQQPPCGSPIPRFPSHFDGANRQKLPDRQQSLPGGGRSLARTDRISLILFDYFMASGGLPIAIKRVPTPGGSVLSHVAADFSAQASSAVLPKAGRQSHAQQKAPSSQFDDLLRAIPDAPPEPRDRSTADAPERAPPAEARPDRTQRNERAERSNRPARADGTDRKANADTRPAADQAPPADKIPAQDQAPATADAAVTETKPAGEEKTVQAEDTDTTAAEGEVTVTSAVTQAAVEALVPQAAVIDPAAAVAATAEPELDGETVAEAGTSTVETGTAPAAATAKSAKPATAGEQQVAALTGQTAGLAADDADVLSALAAKATQGLKESQGDKPGKKAATDAPAQAAKLTGEAAPALSGTPAQAASGETDTTGAKPVQSEIAKVAVDHQGGQGDTNGKPAADQAPAAAGASAATIKAPDTFATHMLPSSVHTAPAASAAGPAPAQSSSGDKPVAIANVAVEVTARISSGKNQFDIRLDPEELGRIHVRVNVDRDGNITTHMVADRPETLDLLRRDTQGLERALQDAGLKTSDNSLQFSLRDQSGNQQQDRQDGQASRLPADDESATTLTTTVIARDYGRFGPRPSGLDIRV
jgi:flagellar hook-length control protein FliK